MATDHFSETLASWHDLFIMLGTASVTLLGLLFVAMSLRDDIRKLADNQALKRMTSQNLTSFTTVFLISIYFLIPDTSANAVAISIALTVILPLGNAMRSIPLYRREAKDERGLFIWYGIVQPLVYIAALIGAFLLGRYETDALSTMMTVMIFLVMIPTYNAWQLTATKTGL